MTESRYHRNQVHCWMRRTCDKSRKDQNTSCDFYNYFVLSACGGKFQVCSAKEKKKKKEEKTLCTLLMFRPVEFWTLKIGKEKIGGEIKENTFL